MSGPSVDILYEHGPCLIVLKPTGVPTQAPPGIDSLEVRIKALLAERTGSTDPVYLGIPHRLDRASSGVMVFAATRSAARKLSKQFERRTVKKIYWAAVEGHVAPTPSPAGAINPPESEIQGGVWTDTLHKVYGQPRAQIVDTAHPGGQWAQLSYRVIGQHSVGSFLEIELETGRTHQIRVQAASRGHAVIGDAHYGSTIPFGEQFADLRLRAIALHARSLAIDDPTTRERVEIKAPPPSAWRELGLDDLA